MLHAMQEKGYAVAHFEGHLQSIALFDVGLDESALPAEVRAWRSTKSLSQQDLNELLAQWLKGRSIYLEDGVSSEDLRSISVSTLQRHIDSHVHVATTDVRKSLRIPSSEEVEFIIESRCIPERWRNSRDFRAQARQLRGVVAYLDAIYSREDVEPMKSVAAATGLDVVASRKLIEQARARGFLTRTRGQIGGRLTDWGMEAASQMNEALSRAKKVK